MIHMSCLILLPNGNSLSTRNISCSTSQRMIYIPAVVKSLALAYIVVVQSPSRVRLFVTPWTAAHRQASLNLTISWSLPEFISISSVMPSSHPILWCSFPPALNPSQHQGLFQWVSCSHRWPNIGASASVIPMSIWGWFPLRWTGLISLLFRRFSRVFSSTTVRRHQFFSTLPSLWSSSHNQMWPLERP